MSSSFPPRRVIIVGAGVAGLSCAAELRRSPHPLQVVVLEGRTRPGGRILTHWLNPANSPPDPNPSLLTAHQPANPQQALENHASTEPQQSAPAENLQLSEDAAPSQPVTNHPDQKPPVAADAQPALSTSGRHEFRGLSSGTVVASRNLPNQDDHTIAVDLGASIMHGCGDDNQLIFRRAITQRIRAPIVAGGGFYESTEHAVWYDDTAGTIIPTAKIVELHNLFFMASRYMAAVASHSDDGSADMQAIFNCGVAYVCEQLDNRTLTPTENAILKKICARSVGYCSPMAVMALMQASAGMETASVDAHIGVPYEEDDPPYPGEIPSMSANGIRAQALRLHKSVMATQRPPKNMIASKKGGPGDRIVLDGYTPFLIDRLKEGVDIRYSQSVCGISKGVKPVDPTVGFQQADQMLAGQPIKRSRAEEARIAWDSDPETANRTVYVSTRSGEMYQGDFVVITIPLGVLQREHDDSSVSFSPPLSEEKQEAIRGMGMGTHNKIILRFKEEDVFWPPKVPQLNCLDPRFQFFNLHSYGKTGVILVHVFAESGFADGYWGLSDEGAVAEVLAVLGGMFCLPHEDTGEGATGEAQNSPTTVAKSSVARRKVAHLLKICEDCRKPLGSADTNNAESEKSPDPPACKSCGHTETKEEAKAEDPKAQTKPDPTAKPEQPTDADGDVKMEGEEELVVPEKRVTWDTLPAPEEYVVTRWDEDPYSLGSYSFMPCGSSWAMIDQIAAPEPRDSAHPFLFFAGEHCSDMGWQCVHGAHETGIRAAREIMTCLNGGVVPEFLEEPAKTIERPSSPARKLPVVSQGADPFWTPEREKALTRALIGYSDVYGNFSDVIDEISFALETFKKEPTDLPREEIRALVQRRIKERSDEDDLEAKGFLRFHNTGHSSQEDNFSRPFHEIHKRERLIGLNGSKLREMYAQDIIRELKGYAKAVAENQVSYREALRKIAAMIYRKDGGLMTKRCLSEYLRTQEFGTGPQKELYLEKYLAQK